MYKLNVFLGILKRQHFWFIAPILFFVGLIGWMSATKKLTQEFTSNSSTVKGYVSTMQGVSQHSPHPNEEYEKGMETLIEARRTKIQAAWDAKYKAQAKELTWSEDLPPDFLNIVRNIGPIELVESEKLPNPSRRGYASFVKGLLPKLAERIGANWAPQRSGGSFRRGTSRGNEEGGEVQQTAVVEWNPLDQGRLESEFDWGDSVPNTQQVLYAQEDLWVLTTLIDIIARTNGDAITQSQAAVKAIDFITIGDDVVRQGRVLRLPVFVVDEEGEDGEEEQQEPEVTFGPDFIAGATDGGMLQSDTMRDYVKNRYYTASYVPIESKEDLLASASVAKRIPVQLRVKMDQRKISDLLVQCANAPLTFEVRQLRYNPPTGRPGESRSMEGFEGVGNTRTKQATMLEDYESLDRTVELFGIVYIFNPPNEALLGGEIQAVEPTSSDDDEA